MSSRGSSIITGCGTTAGYEPALCQYGAERILPLLRAFEKEIEGVRTCADIEHIHRMRVASRRLRATFPIFSLCFHRSLSGRFLKDIRNIAGVLGIARDIDVQLVFLEEFQANPPAGTDPDNDSGFSKIFEILQKRRRIQQKTITDLLDRLEKEKTVAEIRVAAWKFVKPTSVDENAHENERILKDLATQRIGKTLDSLCGFDTVVHDPEDINGHHAMRIAAKNCRYTLEIFQPLYKDAILPTIESLKNLQQILGEIHDCDMWIMALGGDKRQDTKRRGINIDQKCGKLQRGIRTPAILALIRNRQDRRNQLYSRLVSEWENFLRSDMSGIKKIGIPYREPAESGTVISCGRSRDIATKENVDPLIALAGTYPEGIVHAEQVTKLALMLFQELTSLHKFGKKECKFLRYACMLHDIGWAYGKDRHPTTSADLILIDRTIPITFRERIIISLIARYHGKRLPNKRDSDFSSLKQKDRTRVCTLAAILRIADGLDYTHTHKVQAIHCTVNKHEVICKIEYDGDGAIDKNRAQEKSDLFTKIFQRRFSIL